MDGQPKKHNGSYKGWSCKNLAVRSQSLPPSGIQREYQETQEGVAMGGLLAVMLSSMKTPSAVQTEQYSDKKRSYTAFILICLVRTMSFLIKIKM